MPASVPSMAVQKSVIPPSRGPLSAYTIESQRKSNGHEKTAEIINPNSLAKKPTIPANKSPQIYNPATPRPTAASNGNNVDERLRAAKERREKQQKLLASRELNRLQREQRARRYYEQQLQERKKKLLEQRLKEERRRAAVEEKREQRLKEEKERYESAVRKTLEKSKRAQQNQHLRGRKATRTLPRRPPLTPWEKNLVSRLLTPTFSYLARSKSAGCQSGEEVSFHSMNTTIISTSPQKPQQRSGSLHNKSPVSPRPNNNSPRINLAQLKSVKQPDANRKNTARPSGSNTRSPTANAKVKPVARSKTTSPSPDRPAQRPVSRHSPPLQMELPSVPEEDLSVCVPALTPGNSRPVRPAAENQQEKMGRHSRVQSSRSNTADTKTESVVRTAEDRSPPQTPPPSPPQPQVVCKPATRATDAEEASRLLAERRREARLQREREEQECLQREEEERRSREELERRRAEERARQQAEAQRLIEEKRRREEEEQRRAEEERAQAMREAALLQKQREEEQAREREKAEQIRQERELLAQKEEAARQARKKRLEEIMRRTRRTDSPDTKSAPARSSPNAAQPKENTEPVHNGTIEDAAKLPVGTKTLQLGLSNGDDMVPVVAFKERRSLRTLTGLEEIQTHQRAEVI